MRHLVNNAGKKGISGPTSMTDFDIPDGIWEEKHAELNALCVEILNFLNENPMIASRIEITATSIKSFLIQKEVRNEYKSVVEQVVQAAHKIIAAIVESFKKAVSVATKIILDFLDSLLYKTNDHPKWWHLYKHAKKYRVRKKYRKRLMRQFMRKCRLCL